MQFRASVDSRVLSSSVASQRLTLSKMVSDHELYRACVHMYRRRIAKRAHYTSIYMYLIYALLVHGIANALRRGLAL